jgi:hypothetical protein
MGVPFMKENVISEKILKKAIAHIKSAQDNNSAWSRLKGEFSCEPKPNFYFNYFVFVLH